MAEHSFIREIEDPDEEPFSQPPGWTESYPAPEDLFVPFRRLETWASAELARTLLEAEGVSCWVLPPDRMAAIFGCSYTLLVEARRLHRARFVYEENAISEAELVFLATGELS
jgi:hypothetical protein